MIINQERFTIVYQQHSDMLYRIAYLYLKNNAEVEDVLQEVFIKYLKHEEFLDQEIERRWLIRVVINLCKDRYRCFWRRNVQTLEYELPSYDEQYSWVLTMVNELSPKYRMIIHLYYYMGYSVKEISSILKIKESAVKQRLKRAREKLKLEMEDIYE